jgi:hypothetical protein
LDNTRAQLRARTIADDGACSMRNIRMLHEARFDRWKFHPVAAQFHLSIGAPEVFKLTTCADADAIPSSIEAPKRGMLNEAFGCRFR